MAEDETDASVEERAKNGENEEGDAPEEPMVGGGVQLSLDTGKVVEGRNSRKVEQAKLRLMGGAVDVAELLSIEAEHNLVVRVLPHAPLPREKRQQGSLKVSAFDLTQQADVIHIRYANQDAIRDLFADVLAKEGDVAGARLLDELSEFLKEGVSTSSEAA